MYPTRLYIVALNNRQVRKGRVSRKGILLAGRQWSSFFSPPRSRSERMRGDRRRRTLEVSQCYRRASTSRAILRAMLRVSQCQASSVKSLQAFRSRGRSHAVWREEKKKKQLQTHFGWSAFRVVITRILYWIGAKIIAVSHLKLKVKLFLHRSNRSEIKKTAWQLSHFPRLKAGS